MKIEFDKNKPESIPRCPYGFTSTGLKEGKFYMEKSDKPCSVFSMACQCICKYGDRKNTHSNRNNKYSNCYYRERNIKGWFSKKLYADRI